MRSIPDLQPRDPDGDPSFVAGFKLLFVVIGVLLAALYPWRYTDVARAAGAGSLHLRHRRRLRKARGIAVWSVTALSLVGVGFARRLPAALPLTVACLVAAVGWVVAAVVCVRAERADAEQAQERGVGAQRE